MSHPYETLASMVLRSSAGTFDFDPDLPLISRSIQHVRQDPQGPSHRRINVKLNGFFTGERHDQVVAKYQSLKAVLDADDATFEYNDGARSVISSGTTIYPEELSEPEDWKQYEGDYNVSFYYFEYHSHAVCGVGGIQASFVNDDGDTWSFSPAPLWQRRVAPSRSDSVSSLYAPSGQEIASEHRISLQGTLEAADAEALQALMDDLQQTFTRNGTLNYGPFSGRVFVENTDIKPVYPRTHAEYTIELRHFSTDMHRMSMRRSFSRVHRFPKITERPYCGDRSVRQFHNSGQEVTYDITVWGTSISAARALLESELAVILVGGGVEMPGGTETWNDDDMSVAISIKKFHDAAILSNIG